MHRLTLSSPLAAPRRAAMATVASLAALIIAATPATAATRTVLMDQGYSFDPAARTVSRGDRVKWENTAFSTDHDVLGNKPSNYFRSAGGSGGIEPGETYNGRIFDSAGVFPYVCRKHIDSDGMAGSITVPMAGSELADGRFKLTIGVDRLPSTSAFRRVVQVDLPTAGTTFVTFKTTRNAVVYYAPGANGTYRFRTMLERTSNGTRSLPSPTKSLTK